MRPLIFGYMSVPDRVSEEEAEAWVRRMAATAVRERYAVANIFSDTRGQSVLGYQAMTAALSEGRAQAVVIPGFEHIAHVPGMGSHDLRLLSRALGAVLLVADPPADRSAVPVYNRSVATHYAQLTIS